MYTSTKQREEETKDTKDTDGKADDPRDFDFRRVDGLPFYAWLGQFGVADAVLTPSAMYLGAFPMLPYSYSVTLQTYGAPVLR